MKDGQMAGCARLLEGYDYILATAAMPAVTIDLGISNTFSRQPYILDEAAQDKIARSIAESIKEFSDELQCTKGEPWFFESAQQGDQPGRARQPRRLLIY